jgi:hypothetical protein
MTVLLWETGSLLLRSSFLMPGLNAAIIGRTSPWSPVTRLEYFWILSSAALGE